MKELLEKWNIKVDYNLILGMWNESQRFYHNQSHLMDLIDQINLEKSNYTEKEYEKLILCSIFHDIIYDPLKNDNEEKSAEFFIECCLDKNDDCLEIKQMILDTKTHQPQTKLSEIFCKYDMSIVERGFEKLLEWENGIYEEYKSYGNDLYKQGRINFLDKLLDKYPNNTDNLLKLIDHVKSNY